MERLTTSLSDTIAEVNDAFIHTKMTMQVMLVNIISTLEDPVQRVRASKDGIIIRFARGVKKLICA